MQNYKKFRIVSSCLGLVAFSTLGTVNAKNNDLRIKQTIQSAAADPIDYGTEIDADHLATTLDSAYLTETSIAISVTFRASEDYSYSYYCGYGTSQEDFQPATFEYKVLTKGGAKETRQVSLNKINQNAYYDFVGSVSESTLTLLGNIEIVPGETLVDNDYRVYNIFASTRDENNKLVPQKNIDGSYVKYYSITTKDSFFKTYQFSDFASLQYTGCSTFNGFSTINFIANSHGKEITETYLTLSAAIRRTYEASKEDIENGISWIRTMFAFNADSRFIAHYEDGSTKVYETVSDRVDITNSNSSIVLLYKDFKTDGLVDFEFFNFFVYVDIYSTTTGKSVPRSNTVLRFSSKKAGVSEVKDIDDQVSIKKTENPFFVNVDVALIIIALTVLALFVGGTFALYFYKKKKFADDEFKRVRPKEFFKTAAMGLLTVESIVLAISSIIFRSTVLATTFDVYNTIDILVIVFSVASIILGGYFIKYFATAIKNIKAKRDILRLQLNQDKMDDGVLLMPNSKK